MLHGCSTCCLYQVMFTYTFLQTESCKPAPCKTVCDIRWHCGGTTRYITKSTAFNILTYPSLPPSLGQGKHNQAFRPLVRLSIDIANSSPCVKIPRRFIFHEGIRVVIFFVCSFFSPLLRWVLIVASSGLNIRWTLKKGQGQNASDVIAGGVL